ncbi:spore coat protein GerQ [Oceanobacillus bengalensis]|uniref:Spore coat protein GerQ n=1 Tax=Oceanobacillus bengalensis TaxID=1435466 RepID=A0A494YZI3_9BACI|nr:spore coat protein GerQ [Oceanobacillus bengalensis]RKQ15417.1 spore coat protein GerQ [Oceanobacillus bengalensis]
MSGNNPNQPYGAYPYYPQAYYPAYTRQFPQQFQPQQQQQPENPAANIPGMLPLQQSYIENILRLNRGKLATFYLTFEGNTQWNAKTFTGIIEAAGRDHIIISDPETGRRVLMLMVYLDYVIFNEEVNYEYPYADGQNSQLSTYAPRSK